MLRLFWPYTDATRFSSDVDYVYSSTSAITMTYSSGRFADTSAVTMRVGATSYVQLPFGFLRAVSGVIRVAFDYYHVNSGTDLALLTIRSTDASTTHNGTTHTSAGHASTLLTLTAKASTNKLAVQLAADAAVNGNDQLSNSDWQRIELEYTPSNTVGTLKVYLNDVEQAAMTLAAVDTIKGTATVTDDLWFQFGTSNTAGTALCSNLMIWDDTGTADDLTGFIGDVTPIKRVPTSDHYKDGVPSTGSDNYAMVADSAGTNYVTFENDGDYDLYGHAALGVTGTVKAVIVVAEGFLLGNGEARLKAVAKHGVTTDDSTVESGTLATYVAPRNVLQAAFAKCPDGTAWDVTKVDAAYFGVKGVIN